MLCRRRSADDAATLKPATPTSCCQQGHAHPLVAGTNMMHRGSARSFTPVRGQRSRVALFDPRPCPLSPDFESGYKPPFFDDQSKA